MRVFETKYAFTFARPDGELYTRHVYWETLYAIRRHSGQVLAAARAVPLNDMMFAFYASLRDTIRNSATPVLLPAPAKESRPEKVPAETSSDIVPYRFPDVLALTLREERDLPSVPVRRLAAEYSSIVPAAALPAGVQHFAAVPLAGLGQLANLPLPPTPVVPPVLRGFLLSRYSRLGELVSRYEEEEELDSRFHSERMASLVGRAEAQALGTARHYEAVVLGHLKEGELPANERDPEGSGHSYQVDPDADLGRVVLTEITGGPERVRARAWARWALHGNIRRVLFVNEL